MLAVGTIASGFAGGIAMNRCQLLTGLGVEELEALADGQWAPAAQARLDDLLDRRKATPLTAADEMKLDRLLQKTDQPTIFKTRARYTLSQAKAETTAS
jgi:hypothetical protein